MFNNFRRNITFHLWERRKGTSNNVSFNPSNHFRHAAVCLKYIHVSTFSEFQLNCLKMLNLRKWKKNKESVDTYWTRVACYLVEFVRYKIEWWSTLSPSNAVPRKSDIDTYTQGKFTRMTENKHTNIARRKHTIFMRILHDFMRFFTIIMQN